MFHALYFNIVQRDAEYIAEDGFAGIKSVLRLLEIVRFRIVVHIEGYLVDTGQRINHGSRFPVFFHQIISMSSLVCSFSQ